MERSNTEFFGVDFSGATPPGDALWITEAEIQEGTLSITQSSPAWERFELNSTTSRARLYKQFLTFISDHPQAVFGFDFPFGLPQQILEVNSWRQHIESMPDRFDIETPDEFRELCTARAERETNSSASHLRRETDFRYAGQCPYQRQIQNQTLYGQSGILRPLVEDDQARILPMQEANSALPILVEVYPAATLGVLRLYRSGYKNHPESRTRRKRMVAELGSLGFQLSSEATATCIESDDALDSLICTIAAYHASSDGFSRIEDSSHIEGQIFA